MPHGALFLLHHSSLAESALFIYLSVKERHVAIYLIFFNLFIVTCNVVHRLTCITAVRTVLSSSGLGFFFFFFFLPLARNAKCRLLIY